MKTILLQRRFKKGPLSSYVLNNFSSDSKTRPTKLNILPLMFWLELRDILFLVKCFKQPPDNVNIFSYVSFFSSCVRSSSLNKLQYIFHRYPKIRHQFFQSCGPTMELTNPNRPHPLIYVHQETFAFTLLGHFPGKICIKQSMLPSLSLPLL